MTIEATNKVNTKAGKKMKINKNKIYLSILNSLNSCSIDCLNCSFSFSKILFLRIWLVNFSFSFSFNTSIAYFSLALFCWSAFWANNFSFSFCAFNSAFSAFNSLFKLFKVSISLRSVSLVCVVKLSSIFGSLGFFTSAAAVSYTHLTLPTNREV